MAVPVRIPKLGTAMTEGSVTEWYFSDGDRVEEGELLYSLATDKTENDIESPASGILSIQSEIDTDYEVGTTIAEIR
jgi:pyruvate/2-oxoglutarate dehydrogenase complex dihydrolipoamide acyltransferase (E2) component